MKLKTAKNIIADSADLISKAVKIVSEAPYFKNVYDDGEWAQLRINDDGTAHLRWPYATRDYDCSVMEVEECEFPASLLQMSDEDIKAWKTNEKRAYDKRQKEEAAARTKQQAIDAERRDRAEFERLKAKFRN